MPKIADRLGLLLPSSSHSGPPASAACLARCDVLMRSSFFDVVAQPRTLPAQLCRPLASLKSFPRHRHRTEFARPASKIAVISHLQSLPSAWDAVVEQTSALSSVEIPVLSDMLDKGEQRALLLSTLAGLSTSIGGAIAIVKKPGNDLLSFLLGVAIGVMATLSILEMWLHNAVEHGPIAITAATAAGVALYYAAQPYFPDFETHQVSVLVTQAMKLQNCSTLANSSLMTICSCRDPPLLTQNSSSRMPKTASKVPAHGICVCILPVVFMQEHMPSALKHCI